MKKVVRALTLTTAFTLVGFAANGAMDPTSTCWLTCLSLESGVQYYKTFNVTQQDCCSGAALSCPPGSMPGSIAWGEPAQLCGLQDGGW